MAEEPKVQSPTSRWVQLLRHEVIVTANRDLARLAHVGFVMATYANADGTSITVGQETLATLTGSSQESVSRALKTLCTAGWLLGKRRPNKTTEYRLQVPMEPPDWKVLLPLFAETRQRAAHRRAKEQEAEKRMRTPSVDGFPSETADTVRGGIPDTVHGRCPEDSDTVHGRGDTPSMDGVRTPSMAGGTMSHLPPVVTSTEDLETVALPPQPQEGALLASAKIDHPGEARGVGVKACARCGARMIDRPDRTACVSCLRENA
jgi:hypothetical protein